MKKVLMILTGGTIGSINDNGIIYTEKTGACLAAELYSQKYGDLEFTVKQPLNILSENLKTRHWETLVNFILEQDMSGFDGVIITHGSDTLSYSSSMIAMCTCHLNIPIIITAANYVPSDERSNACDNLRCAAVIINTVKRGVFTVYKNDGDDFCTVYIPTRLKEADRFFGRFSSVDGRPLGTVKNDRLTFDPYSPAICEIEKEKQPVLKNRLLLNKNVMLLRPYPSMDYQSISIPENTKAVLHITYHSSTASAEEENSALTFLRKCRQKNVDFYLASFGKDSSAVYESGNILLKNGAVPLYDISDESAYSKLLLAYNILCDDLTAFINRNIYFEYI